MVKRINYEEFRIKILKYLYHLRDEKGASERTNTKLLKNFQTNKISLMKATYELKGMGDIDNFQVGNATIWTITEQGIKKLKKIDGGEKDAKEE